jgi:transcriptional regulator ATRX
MGLGKTLQIIALLVTLSCLPTNAKVDMPVHLKTVKDDNGRPRERRFLIVCPPGIVVNWKTEFKRWTTEETRDALGGVYPVNHVNLQERLMVIRNWYERGGVLLSKSPPLRCC